MANNKICLKIYPCKIAKNCKLKKRNDYFIKNLKKQIFIVAVGKRIRLMNNLQKLQNIIQ